MLFEENFDDVDGTLVGWYGDKWVVSNGVAVRTGDDGGDLRAIMDATGDLSDGYVFSWDWKTDSETHANPYLALIANSGSGDKRTYFQVQDHYLRIAGEDGATMYENGAAGFSTNQWYHFECTYVPDGSVSAPFGVWRLVVTNKTTLAQVLDTGDVTSGAAQTPDAILVELTATRPDQISYDNFKLVIPDPPPVPDTVLIDETFTATNGAPVGWFGDKWVVSNGVAVRTGDDTGDLRAIMNAPGDISGGYVLSFDWRQESTTFANPYMTLVKNSGAGDKRTYISVQHTYLRINDEDGVSKPYESGGLPIAAGQWVHFEFSFSPHIGPYGGWNIVVTNRDTGTLVLSVPGVEALVEQTPQNHYIELIATSNDQVSYDNIRLELAQGVEPFPEIVADPPDLFIPVGDVSKDGVLNGADLALARAYLSGDGGESAADRQEVLISSHGYTSAEALAELNLTDFDLNGDDFFDAADVAIIEALVAGDGGTILYFEDFNQADGVFIADPEIRAGDIAVQESFLASQQVLGNALSSAISTGRGGLRFGPHLFEVDWSSLKDSVAILNAGGFTVQFDWEEKNDGADNWIGFSVGQINCEDYEISDANTDYSILFRDNGQFQAFDNGVTNKDAAVTHASTSHTVQLTYVFESWMPGAEVAVFSELDGTDLFKDSFTWDAGSDRCLGLYFNHNGAGIDNFQISTLRGKPAFYDDWASGTSLTPGVNDGPWDDAENGGLGDGVNNLFEYALGGDPLADDAADILPGFQTLENHFYHIHNERTDDSSLLYTVQLSTNLLSNVWKTNGVEVVSETPVFNGWKAVTQRTEMDGCGFMRLKLGGYFQTPSVPFSFDDPAGPQTEFTEAQKQAQYAAGEGVVPMVLDAFNSGADSVTIPPGDYRFGFADKGAGPGGPYYIQFPLGFYDLVRPDDDPFTIDATGATFWFDVFEDQPPSAHFTVGFRNCANIILKGCIIDGSKRGNIEGQITQIDYANNRFEIEPVPGTTVPSAYVGGSGQRLVPFKGIPSTNTPRPTLLIMSAIV